MSVENFNKKENSALSGNIKNRQVRIVILGGGESGVGSAILAKIKGYDVFLSDMGKIKEKYKNVLLKNGIQWEEEMHT